METRYIEGDFKEFVDRYYFAKPSRAELTNIEGKNRWVLTEEDGAKFIARPKDANK